MRDDNFHGQVPWHGREGTVQVAARMRMRTKKELFDAFHFIPGPCRTPPSSAHHYDQGSVDLPGSFPHLYNVIPSSQTEESKHEIILLLGANYNPYGIG